MSVAGVYVSHTESFKYQIINKFLCGNLYRKEAAELLNVSLRTVSRYAAKVKNKGILGVKHGNCGRKPNQQYSDALKRQIIDLFKKKYFDYNLTHFSEVLERDHNIRVNYFTLWKWFKAEKLIKNPRRRRRKKHVWRSRMPQEGLLLQMDGSHHKFNGKDDWCLISAIDDATSEIPYAEFFSGETTLACMKVLKHIIEIKGVPKAIYTDKAGWSGGMKRTEFSNFQNACEKLGIQVIYANSPEAKGRIERSFRTFQDRLIPELRLEEIADIEAANEYLNERFLKAYWNKEKVVKPQNPNSAYESLDPWLKLDEILCVIEDRKIGSDQTVSYQGQRYLIKSGSFSYAGYMASFRVNIHGELKVYVMEIEVEIVPVTTRQYNKNEIKSFKVSDRRLYTNMYKLASNLHGAVWDHKVTGKPIKLGKSIKKRAS